MSLLSELSWTEQKKIAAWTACRTIEGFPPSDYRVDAYGNVILWSHYGLQTDYGWEIDHAHPTALGGPDVLANLRALQWRKNRELGGHVGNALNVYREQDNALRPMTQPRGLFGLGRR
jgi:hypothetical protein